LGNDVDPWRTSHWEVGHVTLRFVRTIDQTLLDEVTNRLAKELHPEGIWLFGSHAWGTPDEGSDLDLFVVVPDSDEPPVQRVRRAHRCLRGLGLAKDVLVKTRQEFDRLRALPSTLDYLVFHRGRKLYG
jgi:predicted nucleotidyltransferase